METTKRVSAAHGVPLGFPIQATVPVTEVAKLQNSSFFLRGRGKCGEGGMEQGETEKILSQLSSRKFLTVSCFLEEAVLLHFATYPLASGDSVWVEYLLLCIRMSDSNRRLRQNMTAGWVGEQQIRTCDTKLKLHRNLIMPQFCSVHYMHFYARA